MEARFSEPPSSCLRFAIKPSSRNSRKKTLMPKLYKVFATIVLLTLSTVQLSAQWAPMAADAKVQKRVEWWRESRFGMFIHWGVYAIPGRGEWVQWNEQIPRNEYAKRAEQ